MAIRCPKCGSERPEGDAFCGKCGAALQAAAAPPTTIDVESAASEVFNSIVSVAGGNIEINGVTIVQQSSDPEADRRHLDSYLAWMAKECTRLKLGAIDPGAARPGQKPVDLPGIYVDLNVAPRLAGEVALPETARDGEPKVIPVLDKLAEYPRLGLLGAPGSGKSTLGRYLALTLAQAGQGDAPALARLGPAWTHGPLWPVRVVLRQFAESLDVSKPGRAKHVWDFIGGELENAGLNPATGELVRMVAEKFGALFVLDGLDEAGDPARRARVLEAVAEFIENAGEKSRFLVAARPYAWSAGETLPGLPVYHLADFDKKQIRTFVGRWYQALAAAGWLSEADARDKSEELREAVKRDDLKMIVANPLLLTLTATLHSNRARLPDDRADLYHEVVELMLQRWNEASGADKSLLAALEIPTLKLSDLREAFEALAFAAHSGHAGQEGTADISEGQLLSAFEPLLQSDLNKARLVVKYIEQRAGLLVGQGARQGVEQYTFPHRTFQEFLAACHLAAQPEYEQQAESLARENPSHWHQTLLLAARRAGTGRGVSASDALIYRDTVENYQQGGKAITGRDWEVALVAGWQLLEIGGAALEQREQYKAVRGRVAGWLSALLQSGASESERENAVVTLDRLKDSAGLPGLLIALQDDEDYFVRFTASSALGEIGDPAAIPVLLGTLQSDEDDDIRWRAVRSLGTIGNATAIPGLLTALQYDINNAVRFFSARALGQIGSPAAIPSLLTALQKEENNNVCYQAAWALGEIGDPAAVPGLIASLDDIAKTNWGERVCDAAAEALEQIGTEEALAALAAWRAEQPGAG